MGKPEEEKQQQTGQILEKDHHVLLTILQQIPFHEGILFFSLFITIVITQM